MANYLLTDAQRAMILAGGNELDLGEHTPVAGTPAAAPVAAPAAAAPVAAPAPISAPAADTSVASFLTAELAKKEDKILALSVELTNLKAAQADTVACVPDLLKIAQSVIGQMQVSLGNSDSSVALSAKDAVTEHARILPIYKEKFPIARISQPSAEGEPTGQPHPAFAQRLANLNAAK